MTQHPELQYLNLANNILTKGAVCPDRTNTGTTAVFGHQMRFDLAQGFPLLTTKKLHLRSIIYELLWILNGDTNTKYLNDNKVTIWDEWADANGDLGPVYGKQWRNWVSAKGEHIDQISDLVNLIKNDRYSRRQLVNAWNPGELKEMALTPCHCLFQTAVMDNKLHLLLFQRSCDLFLGVPFNIASYALLQMMLAQQCDLEVGEFIWTGGHIHIYDNHREQMTTQIAREPYPFPKMEILRKPDSIFDYKFEDFKVVGYESHPGIKGEVAV